MKEKIIVALDVDFEEAKKIVMELGDLCTFYKVGLTLFYQSFYKIIDFLKENQKRIFLDLKLHDIPYQVRGAAKSLSIFEPEFLTVHASSGKEAIAAAKEGSGKKTKVIAVTVLTSIGMTADKARETVLDLAIEAAKGGADGFVCSGLEVSDLKNYYPDKLAIVPGVRSLVQPDDDQKRIVTPEEAFERGADFIVVGREITRSDSPRSQLVQILERLNRFD
ncbi:MAG: orotidine-5'-phosphate decarboxylase [Actinobacteria bacterium]|nr:orotidine-5'-phosphate decarboxylase [Actinomycetota bacterium]